MNFRDDFEVSCPELDQLVEAALKVQWDPKNCEIGRRHFSNIKCICCGYKANSFGSRLKINV